MGAGCRVKICGTTRIEDALLSADAGADFFGVVVEVAFSPRSLSIEAALPLFTGPPIPGVALVFGMAPERIEAAVRRLRPFALQFLDPAPLPLLRHLKSAHPPLEVWQSVHLPQAGEGADVDRFRRAVDGFLEAGVDALLFDTVAVIGGKTKFGGTGRTSDWGLVRKLMDAAGRSLPVWLAGGIGPGNVARALEAVNPSGIDLCSGVEAQPGIKDPKKIRALMAAIRQQSGIHPRTDG